jgi:hypothetical protein
MRDAAAYARRVRRKVGLSQVAFVKRIGVPVDAGRNWEQGKRLPRGPARALLRIIEPRARICAWGSGQVPTAARARFGLSFPLSCGPVLFPARANAPVRPRLARARIPTVPWTLRTKR